MLFLKRFNTKEIINPKVGVLNVKLNDTIKFDFKYPEKINKIQVNTNLKKNPKIWYLNEKNEKVLNEKSLERQEYVSFEKKENVYSFNYPISNVEIFY